MIILKEVPSKIKMMLAEGELAYFCTTDESLKPHVTPMLYLYDVEENKVFLMTTKDSKKVKNLRSNNLISLTVDVRNPENPFLNYGTMIQGTAHVKDLTENMEIVDRFTQKYPDFVGGRKLKGKLPPARPDTLIEVIPKLMVYWRGTRFTRWKDEQE
ncbi:hypothetical protein AKJ48_04095 [candidate division MSBL1 archaeon SCGC-AAA261O19]|uniref:Pyridoxamine 5'-phosphate oxidase N-terminal domain-containing protein n=1 Tax=candidate division MSBL1 archaeon SCGC-AAA261O19 TaxID=1698277 RepID=A0A133V9T3_9EURY|nr:hypothetical protein AKJ48_04095 [candidate division MSBL1 archaeon SCGC-AAA261O19]